ARLLARDDPVVAVATGPALQRGGVGPGRRLGQRERHRHLTARDRWQPSAAHPGVAVLAEDLAGERCELDTVGTGKVAACRLFHGDADHDEVGIHAAVLDGHAQAEQAELAHAAPRRFRELPGAIPLARAWRELARGEGARRARELLLLGREGEIHPVTSAPG